MGASSHIVYSSYLPERISNELVGSLQKELSAWIGNWGLAIECNCSIHKQHNTLFGEYEVLLDEKLMVFDQVMAIEALPIESLKTIFQRSLCIDKISLNSSERDFMERLSGKLLESLYSDISLWLHKLCSMEKHEVNISMSEETQEFNSALAINVEMGALSFFVHLTPKCLSLFGRRSSIETNTQLSLPKLSQVANSLIDKSVSIGVQLTSEKLSLAAIQDLRVGQVIKLKQAINKPANIRINDEKILKGYLVKNQNKNALYLAEK